MTNSFFITGTDTNIGKTTSIVALTKYYQNHNKSVLNLKPIATGCHLENNILYNSDALALQQASNLDTEYNDINPYSFSPPISPHLVNNDPDNLVTVEHLAQHCLASIAKYKSDYCFIEGAGGWLCPLNNLEYLSDLVLKLEIPVILVVGIKLGCLNHAILTVRAIQNQKIKIHGWIANCLESSQDFDSASNIDYLKTSITAPLLGIINYNADSAVFLGL